MKSGDYIEVSNDLRQSIVNAKGRFSNQFMSGELHKVNPSVRKDMEEGIRTGGFEIDIRKQVTALTDMHKPTAVSSDFWL